MNRTRNAARVARAILLSVGVTIAAQASGQTTDRKPPPATKDRAPKDGSAPSPSAPMPPPERKSGGERIRLDAPVSFPVDI
jgi:hypothetical protein